MIVTSDESTAFKTVRFPHSRSACTLTSIIGLYSVYAPRAFAKSRNVLDVLERKNPSLHRNFPRSSFAATTVNLGIHSISIDHIDVNNSPETMCVLTPVGKFNDALGGHLILWDLKLAIRFPAGSTILLPSALLRHGNTSIQPGETRYCIIQYTAGGLFRWVANNHRTNEAWEAQATAAEKMERRETEEESWQRIVETFLHVDELPSGHC